MPDPKQLRVELSSGSPFGPIGRHHASHRAGEAILNLDVYGNGHAVAGVSGIVYHSSRKFIALVSDLRCAPKYRGAGLQKGLCSSMALWLATNYANPEEIVISPATEGINKSDECIRYGLPPLTRTDDRYSSIADLGLPLQAHHDDLLHVIDLATPTAFLDAVAHCKLPESLAPLRGENLSIRCPMTRIPVILAKDIERALRDAVNSIALHGFSKIGQN